MKLFLFSEIFQAADGDISNIHETGMPFEEGRGPTRKNRVDFSFPHDGDLCMDAWPLSVATMGIVGSALREVGLFRGSLL
jgi:hypothetical protein